MRYINIIGTGKALPMHEVTAQMLDEKCGLAKGETLKTTSLSKRYFLKDETASDITFQAIKRALTNANLTVDDIDCIISANATMQQMIPFNGAGVHALLKTKRNIPSFDINMTCLSAVRAFDMASYLTDTYKTILIVSCDIPSVGLDWSDIRTAGILGDGAAAMLVQKSTSGGLLLSNFETYSEGFEFCQIRGCGSLNPPSSYQGDYTEMGLFEMNGKKLFKLSAKVLPEFIDKSLKTKGLCLDDIDWIVPHQASQASLNHIIRMLNIDKSKMIDIFEGHGNQVAASVPTALHELFMTKDLKSGQKIMMIGTSAGIGLGLVVWEVP